MKDEDLVGKYGVVDMGGLKHETARTWGLFFFTGIRRTAKTAQSDILDGGGND